MFKHITNPCICSPIYGNMLKSSPRCLSTSPKIYRTFAHPGPSRGMQSTSKERVWSIGLLCCSASADWYLIPSSYSIYSQQLMILYWNSPATSWTFHGIDLKFTWDFCGLVSLRETFIQNPWDVRLRIPVLNLGTNLHLGGFAHLGASSQGWLKIKKKWQQHTQQNCVLFSPVESDFLRSMNLHFFWNQKWSVIWSLPCPSCWKLIPSAWLYQIFVLDVYCPAQPWATRVVPNWLVGWLGPGFWVNLRLDFSDYVRKKNSAEVPTTGHCSCTPWCIPSPLLWRRTSVSQFAPGKLSSLCISGDVTKNKSYGIGLATRLESQHRRAFVKEKYWEI